MMSQLNTLEKVSLAMHAMSPWNVIKMNVFGFTVTLITPFLEPYPAWEFVALCVSLAEFFAWPLSVRRRFAQLNSGSDK